MWAIIDLVANALFGWFVFPERRWVRWITWPLLGLLMAAAVYLFVNSEG